MKNTILAFCLLLVTPLAHAVTLTGTYKTTSFDGVPATLTIKAGGAPVISAPGATCVMSFEPGSYQGDFALGEYYGLPVVEACDSPASYRYSLIINRDLKGKIMSASIRGTNGKMTWTYFSN